MIFVGPKLANLNFSECTHLFLLILPDPTFQETFKDCSPSESNCGNIIQETQMYLSDLESHVHFPQLQILSAHYTYMNYGDAIGLLLSACMELLPTGGNRSSRQHSVSATKFKPSLTIGGEVDPNTQALSLLPVSKGGHSSAHPKGCDI